MQTSLKLPGNAPWGGWKGKPTPLNVNDRPLTEDSPRNLFQVPRGKDIHCISHKKSTTPTPQPMRNNHPELFAFLQFKTTPPDFLLHHKITFCSFVYWSRLCFCYSLLVLNGKFLLLQNKSMFAGQVNFIFKVNILNNCNK